MTEQEIDALLEFVRAGTIAPVTATRLLVVKGEERRYAEKLVTYAVAERGRPKILVFPSGPPEESA